MTARRTAAIAGALYLVTIVTSIPALALQRPVLSDPARALVAGGAVRVQLGSLLDLVNAAACVGTAVVLFPLLRGLGERAALGFVASRVLEAAAVVVGAVAGLALVTLEQGGPGVAPDQVVASPATAAAAVSALVALHGWAFVLGPSLMPGINALLLAPLLYRSGLVPRIIPTIGLVGAPLLLASVAATVLGMTDQVSAIGALAALPVAAWELSLGLWMVLRGLRVSP